MNEDYLKPRQVADYLGVSTGTIRRMIKKGQIPALHLSQRVIRIPRKYLDDNGPDGLGAYLTRRPKR